MAVHQFIAAPYSLTAQRRLRPITCRRAVVTSVRYAQSTVIEPRLQRKAAEGREHSVATGRFQASEFHWQLSGDELDEMAVASRSNPGPHAIAISKAGIGCEAVARSAAHRQDICLSVPPVLAPLER